MGSFGEDRAEAAFTGGEALALALVEQGVEVVFGTVGHGNLAFIDALAGTPQIRFVSAFHEQVAIHAADAYFRVSGRVAVVTTTVGPGATNLATGLGDALLDSSGVVVITGGVPTDYIAREPLQALSVISDDAQSEIFRPLTKRVIRVHRAADLVSQLHRALQEAVNGAPGPVLLHVPLDLFSASVTVPKSIPPVVRHTPAADPAGIAAAAAEIGRCQRPVLYCGGGALAGTAPAAIQKFAQRLGIPVATTMSGQGVIGETDEVALGTTGVVGTRPGNYALQHADLVIAVGTRFPEMDASSWRPEYFASFPPARLVQIDIDARQIDRVFPASVGICADAGLAVHALDHEVKYETDFTAWREELRKISDEWRAALAEVRSSTAEPLEPASVLQRLRAQLPDNAVLVSGVGIRHAVAQHFDVLSPRSLIVASGFGTMGQEVAAPLGAALARPQAPVVAVIGDGALLACLAALPTAAAASIDLVWIVLDNGGYASIAVYQAKHFGRYLGTQFRIGEEAEYVIDYAALAGSFGIHAHSVRSLDELAPTLATALAESGPSLVVVPITATPRNLGSGYWDVNDLLAAAGKLTQQRS